MRSKLYLDSRLKNPLKIQKTVVFSRKQPFFMVRVARLELAASWSQRPEKHFFWFFPALSHSFRSDVPCFPNLLSPLFPGAPGRSMVWYVVKRCFPANCGNSHCHRPGRLFLFQGHCTYAEQVMQLFSGGQCLLILGRRKQRIQTSAQHSKWHYLLIPCQVSGLDSVSHKDIPSIKVPRKQN